MCTPSNLSIRSEPKSWVDLLSFPTQPPPLQQAQHLSNWTPITYDALAGISPSGPSGLHELLSFNSNVLLPSPGTRRNVTMRPDCESELLLANTRAMRSLAELQALIAENWDRTEVGSALARTVAQLYPSATCLVFICKSAWNGYEFSGMHSLGQLDSDLLAPLIEDLRYSILREAHYDGEPVRFYELGEYCRSLDEGLFLPEDLIMYVIPTSAVSDSTRDIPHLRASLVLLAPWDCPRDNLALDTLYKFTNLLVWQLERIHAIEESRG
jgi:hypothetical protein